MDKGAFGRKDRLIKEKRHDAYREQGKLPEPSECMKCHAIFMNGRWTWQESNRNTYETICPACRRIDDKLPAGLVDIKGAFFIEHKDEIINLIHNIEKQEKDDRPLERIMSLDHEKAHALVSTTGIHLARRIGEALSRAFKGDLKVQYADADKTIRVAWERSN